jgi:hypothetical protein
LSAKSVARFKVSLEGGQIVRAGSAQKLVGQM